MKKQTRKRWRPGFLVPALAMVVGALILAGCGGGGSSSSGSGSSTTASSSGSGSESSSSGGSESEAKRGGMFKISSEAKACLKEKGVELPEGGPGGEGGPPEGGGKPEGLPEGGEGKEGGPPGGFGGEGSEEMQKAFEECGVETPEFKGGAAGKPSRNSAAFKKQVKEYAACVREHGYEIAEPNFSGEGPVFEKAESESAAFKKASASCESLLKGGPKGSGSESGGEPEGGSEG